MDKLEKLLIEENDWRSHLYSLIKKQLTKLVLKYKIGHEELEESTLPLFIKANDKVFKLLTKYQIGLNDTELSTVSIYVEVCNEIERDRKKYLTHKEVKDSTNDRGKLLRRLLAGEDETLYELNNKANTLVQLNYIYPLVKEYELKKTIQTHRNQKGKKWRTILYKNAKEEYGQNKALSRKAALRTAYNRMPTNKDNFNDWDKNEDSIYRGFLTYMNQ